ncbi:MAG: glutathione-disulfide reductase [Gammaproteobacteria bacterium]|nr:glutathione-disulfide reductase [Gammaproteobacteria bacterium]
MAEEEFDLVVIGAGSGGIAAANRAGAHGARVALFEPDRLGGTCVNRGCVPKKLSWLAARAAEALHNAEGYGFKPLEAEQDFGRFRRDRDEYIRILNERYAEGLEKNEVALIREQARFEDAHTLVAGERRLKARHVLIATGARTRPLDIPGGDRVLDSDDFFKLDTRPERVAMIGAGYIAAELGGIFAALGSHVDMYLGGRRPLAHFDSFIGEHFEQALAQVGIHCLSAGATRLEREGGVYTLHTDDGESEGYDAVFAAIGRIPNVIDLRLDAAGVSLDETGAVVANLRHETNVERVYAIGDVTGRANALTPVAIAAGRRLSDRLFGGKPARPIDPDFIPSVVFSHPPVGTVGLTEADARARYGEKVRVYTNLFTPLSSALVREKKRAAVKLVTVGEDERIVGLHIIGDGADELLQGFAVAIRMGATKRDFDETVAIHPTTAEELVTLG